MSESMFTAAYAQMCDNLLALRRSGEWDRTYSSFEAYAAYRFSLSKTRAKLFCDFAKFSSMARKAYLPLPDTPDNIAPLLKLPQHRWMDTWGLVALERPLNAQKTQAVLDRFNVQTRKKIPAHILNGRRVRKAAETLAEIGDGEMLVDQIGPKGLGGRWDEAVTVVIDADQRKRDSA